MAFRDDCPNCTSHSTFAIGNGTAFGCAQCGFKFNPRTDERKESGLQFLVM